MTPPIILDLDGNGIQYTSLKDSVAAFDLDRDGFREKMSWFAQGDAILIYDINGSGIADDINEFSIAKLSNSNGDSDLGGLKTLDSNKDNKIPPEDFDCNKLYAWKDNGDRILLESEIFSFKDLSIEINLEEK